MVNRDGASLSIATEMHPCCGQQRCCFFVMGDRDAYVKKDGAILDHDDTLLRCQGQRGGTLS